MPEQLSFDLPVRSATGRDDFFLSPSNELAVAEIDNWRGWPARKLALIGPEGSGKTHLSHVWASDAEAEIIASADLTGRVPEGGNFVIEDIQAVVGNNAAEEALFHWHNLVLAEGGFLLLTGNRPPSLWPIGLPDLASRLRGTPMARLDTPDDPLLQAVLLKLFADRQITPPATLIPWLLKRMDRSFVAAGSIVAALDERALATGHPIGRKLATEVLDSLTSADRTVP